MENAKFNPLAKHFRQPAIYLKLPSQGQYYPHDTLEIGVTGAIPVYPMTVRDELTLKTPDALMNGEGMASVISSCCPTIKDPWSIPAIDVDAIFIAIRLASYGSGMDFNTTCPSCKQENENRVNLTSLLETIPKTNNYHENIVLDDLIIRFKPQAYRDINYINLATFEQQRLIINLTDADIPDPDKKRLFEESFNKLTQLNIKALIGSIESITADNITVTESEYIADFLDNCSRQTFSAIKDKIAELGKANQIPPMDLTCSNCSQDYTSDLLFDQANFFG